MPIKLYVDEDAMSHDLADALRLRGVDVVTALDAGMLGRSDEEQLMFASIHSRALFSFNTSDFVSLHSDFLLNGKNHAGIIVARQRQLSIGEQMRRLLRIVASLTEEEMINRLEYLASWHS